MKQFILIENPEDISHVLPLRERLRDASLLTPSVQVAWELERKGLDVQRLQVKQAYRNDISLMESRNHEHAMRLRLATVDFLNSLDGYEFRDYHHPDLFICCYKRLLFSFVYRYELLHQFLRLGCKEMPETIIYIVDDTHEMEGRIRGSDMCDILNRFFPEGQRGFSNILKWSHQEIVHPIVDSSEMISNKETIPYQPDNSVVLGRLLNLYARMSSSFYDVKCRLSYGSNPVALVDLEYLRENSIHRSSGVRVYTLRRHMLERLFREWKKLYLAQSVDDIVARVDKGVFIPLHSEGLFKIRDYDYYEHVKGVLKALIREEIMLYLWADQYAARLKRVFNVVAAHSDRMYSPEIYALFAVLKMRGVKTYSYAHGAEGFCNYFWQERLTTASASIRIVDSDRQKEHFEKQQNKYLKKEHHSCIETHAVKFSIDDVNMNSVDVNRFDVIYVMNEITLNTLYTTINYPDVFDLYQSQRSIIRILYDIASKYSISVCIRPSNGILRDESKHLFGDIPEGVHLSWDVCFPQIMPQANKVITDSASTSLFQSLRAGKQVLCFNCYNSVNDIFRKYLKEYYVRYLEANVFREEEIRAEIGEFLGINHNVAIRPGCFEVNQEDLYNNCIS